MERSDENGLEINTAENEDSDYYDVMTENIQNNKNKSADNKNSLFGSAHAAVMTIVKIATDALDIRQKDTNHFSNNSSMETVDNHMEHVQPSKCITPGYIMVCHGCNDTFYKK